MGKTRALAFRRFTEKWKNGRRLVVVPVKIGDRAEILCMCVCVSTTLFTPHVNTLNFVNRKFVSFESMWSSVGYSFLFVCSFWDEWNLSIAAWMAKCSGINYIEHSTNDEKKKISIRWKRTLNSSCHANDSIRCWPWLIFYFRVFFSIFQCKFFFYVASTISITV